MKLLQITAFSFLLSSIISCSKNSENDEPKPLPIQNLPYQGIIGKVTTIAGSGEAGITDGTLLQAKFMNPKTIIVNNTEGIFVGQSISLYGNSGLIRKIEGNNVSTLQGDPPNGGNINQDGLIAHFGIPSGMLITLNNEIYISNKDSFGRQYITRFYQNPLLAITIGSAPGGLSPLLFASGESVNDLCMGNDGTLYLVEDSQIKKLSNGLLSDFTGSTTAGYADGNGTNARFNGAVSICVDSSGNLFVLELVANGRIRKITPSGEVTTFATTATSGILTGGGGDYGKMTIGSDGILYVSDPNGHRILRISTTGQVTTLAGGGYGNAGDLDATGSSARLKFPTGIFFKNNKLYITDTGNNKIKKIE